MGNTQSAKKNAGVSATPEAPPSTETQLDSIQVTEVNIPVHGKVFNVNFGLVNTIKEEIEKLVYDYHLSIPPEQCQLILHERGLESDSKSTIMDPDHEIEFYKDPLTSSSSTVELKHNPPSSPPSQPNLGSLNVDMRG